MYSRPSFHSSEPIPRDPTDRPNSPKSPKQQKQKTSNARPQSSVWGWPRLVSVEVDVEDRRRQKKNEAMPVNATAELSRPDQSARNESFQKAHERFSHPLPPSESSTKADNENTSRPTDAKDVAPEQTAERSNEATMDVKAPEQTAERSHDVNAGTESREKPDASEVALPPEDKTEDLEPDAVSERADTRREAERSLAAAVHAGTQQAGRSRNPSTPGTFPRDDTESVYSQSSADHKEVQLPSNETKRSLNYDSQSGKAPTSHSQGNSSAQDVLETQSGPIPNFKFLSSPEHLDSMGDPPPEERTTGASKEGERRPDSPDSAETSPVYYTRDGKRHTRGGRQTVPYIPPWERPRPRGPSVDAIEPLPPLEDSGSPTADDAAENAAGSTTMERSKPGSPNVSTSGGPSSHHDSGNGEAAKAPGTTYPLSSWSASVPRIVDPADPGRSILPPGFVEQEMKEQPNGIDPDYISTEEYERLKAEYGPEGEAEREEKLKPEDSRKSISGPTDVVGQVSIPTSMKTRTGSKAAKKVTLPPPKITIQEPSEATQEELADPHPTPAEPMHNDEYRIISRNGSVVSVQHTVRSASDRLGPRPLGKRTLYVRKARNLAARPIFLNAALGRKVGRQTKDRLRRLARGEEVPKLPVSARPHAPDFAPLKKQGSFVRKARNVVARPSLMNLAFGRQVAGETKPALRHMAAGDSVIFGEAVDSEAAA